MRNPDAGDHGSTLILLHGVGVYIERRLPTFFTLAAQLCIKAAALSLGGYAGRFERIG